MLKKAIVLPIILLIKIYQKIVSPYLPNACRYNPTCSQYAIEALKKHGILKGIYLAGKRLVSCHPWGGNGFDPVL